MSRPVKIVSRSIIIMCSVVVFLYSGSYSRVLDPLMSIRQWSNYAPYWWIKSP